MNFYEIYFIITWWNNFEGFQNVIMTEQNSRTDFYAVFRMLSLSFFILSPPCILSPNSELYSIKIPLF